jgi:lysozyme
MVMKLVSIISDILSEQIATTFASAVRPPIKPSQSQTGGYETGRGPAMYSNRALNLIKKWETFQDKAYLCDAGKKTIGYGTRLDFHPEIKKGVCITEPKASELLKKDLDTLVTPVIKKNVKVKLKQNQIDALYSLIHNIGMDKFVNSKVLKLLNSKEFPEMKKNWLEFQMADGKVLRGLRRRREDELSLFFT